MAESNKSDFRMDVQTGVRAAVIGTLVFIGLVIVLNLMEIQGIIIMAAPLAQLLVGMLYARSVFRKVQINYGEAAAGGGVAGAVAGFLIIVGGSLVGELFEGTSFPFSAGFSRVSQTGYAADLLNAMLVGAALAALGSLWIVLSRTKRIE